MELVENYIETIIYYSSVRRRNIFVDAGINDGIKQQQFIEVLNPKRSYKNLAQVIDVFDQYTLCKN